MDIIRNKQIAANLRAMAIEGVRLLALEPVEQVKAFPSIVSVPDELARALGDPLDLIENSGLDGVFPIAVSAELNGLRSLLQPLFVTASDARDVSVAQSLDSPGWRVVRGRARELLKHLQWEGPPSGGFSTFIPSQ